MVETRIDLPDGMNWTFSVEGQDMFPTGEDWPTTDGGTAIGLRWDPRNTGVQDALEDGFDKLLETIRSYRIVK